MERTETPAQAKAAGQPKSPVLWPPHQRPTLQRRNVLDHLTDEQKPTVAKKLNAAYALEDYAAAKQALDALHRELMVDAKFVEGGTSIHYLEGWMNQHKR